MVVPEPEPARQPGCTGPIGRSTEFQGFPEAKNGVFGGFRGSKNKIAHRAGGYAGWAWFPTICDLRCPEHHLVQLKKSVKRNFCSHILIYSGFRVRHDAGVFRPNRRHEQNRNGLKPLKPGSFGFWGPPTKKVVGKSPPGISASCAIAAIPPSASALRLTP